MVSTARDIAAAYPKAAPIADEIVAMSGRLGIPDPGWLANLMNFETGGTFSPQIINRGCKRRSAKAGTDPLDKCATGLIQFMPATAKGLGTSNHELYNMSAHEQLKYVEEYFAKKVRRGKTLHDPTDIYMAVFFPAAMSKGPNFSMYDWYVRNRSQSKADSYLSQNPGIKTAADYANKANKNAKLPTGLTGVEVGKVGGTSIRVYPYLLTFSFLLLAGSFYFYKKQTAGTKKKKKKKKK